MSSYRQRIVESLVTENGHQGTEGSFLFEGGRSFPLVYEDVVEADDGDGHTAMPRVKCPERHLEVVAGADAGAIIAFSPFPKSQKTNIG